VAKIMKISIIGGDARQIAVANYFSDDKNEVYVYGFNESLRQYFADSIIFPLTLEETISEAEAVILPLAYSQDSVTVNAPEFSEKIYVFDVISAMQDSQILFAGNIDNNLKSILKDSKLKFFDYFAREELAILNAVPTAEGAIKAAIEGSKRTISGSEIAILGFGRVGKTLAHQLRAFNQNLTIFARSCADLAWAKNLGYNNLNIKNLSQKISKFDIIFNTIPAKILTKEALNNVKPDVFIIDIASRPGGTDFEFAKSRGINVAWELGIPGKVAPDTAGKIIKETITNILSELEAKKSIN
jgi:dipicolinate synthase subunit A